MAILLVYKPDYTFPGLGIVLSGVPVYFIWRAFGKAVLQPNLPLHAIAAIRHQDFRARNKKPLPSGTASAATEEWQSAPQASSQARSADMQFKVG